MSTPVLYIGNKNYSSWSFRPWIALRVKDIPFEENLQPFDVVHGNPHFRTFSPTGKVPVLVDDGLTVWESLAILEYAADKHPDKGLWPKAPAERAVARSAAHEMHAGFTDLRAACPMNIRRPAAPIETSAAVKRDVRRIEELWAECLSRSGGPFLFGDFTIADAMYAPVVNRFQIYELSETQETERYTRSMTSLSAWKEWETAARAEPWIVDHDEA